MDLIKQNTNTTTTATTTATTAAAVAAAVAVVFDVKWTVSGTVRFTNSATTATKVNDIRTGNDCGVVRVNVPVAVQNNITFTITDNTNRKGNGIRFGVGDEQLEKGYWIGYTAHGWGIHAHDGNMLHNSAVVVNANGFVADGVGAVVGVRVRLCFDAVRQQLLVSAADRAVGVYSCASLSVQSLSNLYFCFSLGCDSQSVTLHQP